MKQNKKLKTIMSRREQVKKAGSTVFIVTAIAAVIVMFSLMSLRFLWEKKSYNDRVINAKTKARDDIRDNLSSLDKLAEQYPQLDSSASTNAATILHALPPVYDYAALVTSLDGLASRSSVTATGSGGTDGSETAVKTANESKPVVIPITLQATGNYAAIREYISNLERSIRPIHIKNIALTGSSSNLKASITAATYYQPARSLDVLRSEIR